MVDWWDMCGRVGPVIELFQSRIALLDAAGRPRATVVAATVREIVDFTVFPTPAVSVAPCGDVIAPHPHPIATAKIHRLPSDRIPSPLPGLSHIAAEMPADPTARALLFR